MANHLLASVYGSNGHAIGGAAGTLMSLPSDYTVISPASASDVYNGVTCLSIIELLPTGVRNRSIRYAAIQSVATLDTDAG